MDRMELETRFQPQTVGTICFTPETLISTYEQNVRAKISLAEFSTDAIPTEQRIEKAILFMTRKSSPEYDHQNNLFILAEKYVAILVILYGTDAINALFNKRYFEFKKEVQQ